MNNGLMIKAEGLICFSALHFSLEDLSRPKRDGFHTTDLVKKDEVFLNIDLGQMGVGGDDSWGAYTHAEYSIPFRPIWYSFVIKPVMEKQIPWDIYQKEF